MPDELNGHYRGEALRAIAMPLGGIGTGSIALAGDGSLRQWQIHNQANHLGCVPQSFFAIWARGNRPPEPPVVRVLQSAALIHAVGPIPPTSNDHVVPDAHQRLLARVPGVTATEFEGRYPIANVKYLDDALPIEVSLEAFNPFIPLRSQDSGIPAILLNFTISNPTNRVMLVSIAGSLQNATGWDGLAPIVDDHCDLYGGNFNSLIQTGEQTIIAMDNAWLPRDDPRAGSMTLAVDSPSATWLTQWNDLDAFWADFSGDGQLSNRADSTPSATGRTWSGALAVPMKLQPGDLRTVQFTLAWHFPNRVINWSQKHYFKFDDPKSRFYLGNQYNTRFRSAADVVLQVSRERERLTAATRLARDTFYDTTLPFALIDAVTSQVSVARSPTCFWTESGSFYGFEGCNGISTTHIEPMHGSCPLNCTHVWNYEMAVARLFPDLERTMRDTEWDIQQHPSGYLPHRVLLPTYLPRPWERDMGGPAHPALDGLLGAILKSYREHLAFGDETWLDHHWPALQRALEFIWRTLDPEHTGVIEAEQPNTYDISIFGANTFIGTLYLAALRAMEELANSRNESELARKCRSTFEAGKESLEHRLWNGSFYIQEVDFAAYPIQNWGIGCHTDQLVGQWWADLLGLGDLLDPQHTRAAAVSIMHHNFKQSFIGFNPPVQIRQLTRHFAVDDDQGLMLCSWPNGGRPEIPTQYCDEVWTGMEYEIAALLLQVGEPDLGLKLVEAVRRRHDGRRQNPWNDIECGDHYAQAMSSWSLLEAASGYHFDASKASMAFVPRVTPGDFRAPFVARDGWGTFSQHIGTGRAAAEVELKFGALDLQSLHLTLVSGSVTASVNAAPVSLRAINVDGHLELSFVPRLQLHAGDQLAIVVSA